MRSSVLLFTAILSGSFLAGFSQPAELDVCNIVWTSRSINSSESMPCGGHDIGMNVWVEDGELLFYLSRSGTFDENNGFLKLGRVRIKLEPNPFDGDVFRQELVLKEGCVKVSGTAHGCSAQVTLWADVQRPVVHADIACSKPVKAEAIFESWRHSDYIQRPGESFANSYKWGPVAQPVTFHDSITFQNSGVVFFHRNRDYTVFDPTVKQQGLESIRDSLFNPLPGLTFGGFMEGSAMRPAGKTSGEYLDTDFEGWKLQSQSPSKTHTLSLYLHTGKTRSAAYWLNELNEVIGNAISTKKEARAETLAWWKDFWNRSYIFINPGSHEPVSDSWQTGRNYQLFRYMLACNAYGDYPTKFNGGMFTYDPVFIDSTRPFTPDYRNWGGGIHTAQNQRLVYFPMLKSGDFDMMKVQFEYYRRIVRNAELRSEVYWEHKGACFTEQMENFGLPNSTEYGYSRPDYFDKGVEYNSWLEYEWDTALEFCLMILETQRYNGNDIRPYMPLIESCLTFFDEHYQYLAKIRGTKTLDEDGHLILYPGSAGETYKMAYNASSTVAALTTVLTRLLELPDPYLNDSSRKVWQHMLSRIPPVTFRECEGHVTIAPAKAWERVNNVETMQLYPVFPWGIYGVGKPGLDTAINTWKYDPDAIRFRSHVGWKQDNIWAARLGLADEAADLAVRKMGDSGRRFPAFWGPGFDWTPDHNWGGSGMIGLQEMLMQVDGQKIFLFPAWPKDWDVHFKLHAPYNTTVEGIVRQGKLEKLEVLPVSRVRDVVIL